MFKKLSYIFLLLLFLSSSRLSFASPELDRIKSIFIVRIISLTTHWAHQDYKVRNVRMCVVSNDNIFNSLRQITQGKNFSIKVVNIDNEYNETVLERCHALYISDKNPAAKTFLNNLKGKPILTITDEEMIWEGAIVSFYRSGDKLKFYVHYENMQNAGFKLSPKLLEIAHMLNYKK